MIVGIIINIVKIVVPLIIIITGMIAFAKPIISGKTEDLTGNAMILLKKFIAGVAIFYVFNSVGDQAIVKEISGAEYEIIELLLIVLEMLSIGVAFVLGFLIIYANHFLIRRRKKEFGVYMLLGMGKKDISKILVSETVLVGTISLAAGLLLGVFASQFMSIIVGKLFQADMQAYHFVVSGGAVIKTVINFAVMYLIVVLFHSVTISKYQLIDLLSADKKTEKQVLKNRVVASVLFVIAAVSLGVAYYRVGFCTGEGDIDELITHVLIGIVATLFAAGLIVLFISIFGTYRFNYSLNRMHSSAMCDTLVLMLFIVACVIASGVNVVSGKFLLLLLIMWCTSPVVSHIFVKK